MKKNDAKMKEDKIKENNFPCDVCQSSEAVEVPHCREYTNGNPIFICKKCGLVHTKKRNNIQDMADSWTNDIFGKKMSPKSYTSNNPWVKARLTFVGEFINQKLGLKGKKVCDIGAGEGFFLTMAKARGSEVFGIEPSGFNCGLLSQTGIDNFMGTIEDYGKNPKRNYKADIVTMMWTLECCTSPNNMLKEAYNILKEDGYVAYSGGSRMLVPFKKPLYLYFSETNFNVHPLHPSFNTIKALLAENGFEVVYHNSYIDNDILCVIAKKVPRGKKLHWERDDYKKLINFFERWHKETLYYPKEQYLNFGYQ